MTTAVSPTLDNLIDLIQARGFCFVPGQRIQQCLTLLKPDALSDWQAFAASWDDLTLDEYMADGGRYRRRRYAVLSAGAGEPVPRREPHQPHYQSLDYNRLNGGVARHFAPIDDKIVTGSSLGSILTLGLGVFQRLLPGVAAHLEVHQFRIEAGNEQLGMPTPEGVHRDGVDFVLVLMVRRVNIRSGTTEIYDLEQRRLDSFTLTDPLDGALVDDRRAMHGVTPIEPLDPEQPAWRDVLVVTYRRQRPEG